MAAAPRLVAGGVAASHCSLSRTSRRNSSLITNKSICRQQKRGSRDEDRTPTSYGSALASCTLGADRPRESKAAQDSWPIAVALVGPLLAHVLDRYESDQEPQQLRLGVGLVCQAFNPAVGFKLDAGLPQSFECPGTKYGPVDRLNGRQCLPQRNPLGEARRVDAPLVDRSPPLRVSMFVGRDVKHGLVVGQA